MRRALLVAAALGAVASAAADTLASGTRDKPPRYIAVAAPPSDDSPVPRNAGAYTLTVQPQAEPKWQSMGLQKIVLAPAP